VASPLDALRRLSASSLALLLSRAEFASLELAQARAQLAGWFGLALAAAVLALLALMAASALLVVVLWSTLAWITLLLLAVAYAIGAVLVLRHLQREIRAAPPLLAQTLEELSKDRDALLGRQAAEEEAASKAP
jgi:uncharacterized membrane protein YqjE